MVVYAKCKFVVAHLAQRAYGLMGIPCCDSWADGPNVSHIRLSSGSRTQTAPIIPAPLAIGLPGAARRLGMTQSQLSVMTTLYASPVRACL